MAGTSAGRSGTLLKAKCDFTSVQGINRAFGVVFKDQKTVPQLKNVSDLRQLEFLRQLIVHRAGVVDEEYLQASKKIIPVGSRLELSVEEVAAAANLVVAEGIALLSLQFSPCCGAATTPLSPMAKQTHSSRAVGDMSGR